jgi:trans-2-enoyl-CoA reductase
MNQLEELMVKLQKQVQDVVETDVVETIKDMEIEHIKQDVYDAYNPVVYDRRKENEGLIDRNNIKGTIQNENNTISVDVTNDTIENPDYPPTTGEYIDSIIESGEGYIWKNSEIYKNQPFPRPFTENTYEDLKNNKQHIQALKKGLNQYNIK